MPIIATRNPGGPRLYSAGAPPQQPPSGLADGDPAEPPGKPKYSPGEGKQWIPEITVLPGSDQPLIKWHAVDIAKPYPQATEPIKPGSVADVERQNKEEDNRRAQAALELEKQKAAQALALGQGSQSNAAAIAAAQIAFQKEQNDLDREFKRIEAARDQANKDRDFARLRELDAQALKAQQWQQDFNQRAQDFTQRVGYASSAREDLNANLNRWQIAGEAPADAGTALGVAPGTLTQAAKQAQIVNVQNAMKATQDQANTDRQFGASQQQINVQNANQTRQQQLAQDQQAEDNRVRLANIAIQGARSAIAPARAPVQMY